MLMYGKREKHKLLTANRKKPTRKDIKGSMYNTATLLSTSLVDHPLCCIPFKGHLLS